MKNLALYVAAALVIVVTLNFSTANAGGWVPGHYLPNGTWQNGYYDINFNHDSVTVHNSTMTQPTDNQVDYRVRHENTASQTAAQIEPTDYRQTYDNEPDEYLQSRREHYEEDNVTIGGDNFRLDPRSYLQRQSEYE